MSETQLQADKISEFSTDCSLLIDGIPSINNFENIILNPNLLTPLIISSPMSSTVKASKLQREILRLKDKVSKLENMNENLYTKIQLLETDVLLHQSEASTAQERISEVLNQNKKIAEKYSRQEMKTQGLKIII